MDEPQNQLEVIVPDDQLTNAIGRKGQNVKLAARLLGWKVDIFTESRYNEASAAGHSLEQVAGVAEIPVASLQEAGYTDLDKLRQASDEELVAALSLTESQLEHLRQALNFLNPGEDGGAKPDATADVSREEAHDEGQAE